MITEKEFISKVLRREREIIFSLAFFFLALLLLMRFLAGNPLSYGEESFLHIANINNVLEGSAPWFSLNIFELFLIPFHFLLPLHLLFIVPILLSFSSLTLYFWHSRRLDLPKKENFFFLLFLVLSPAFLYHSSTLSFYSFFSFFFLFLLWLLEQNNKKYSMIAVPLFFLLPSLGLLSGILGLLLLLAYNSFRRTASSRLEPKKISRKAPFSKVKRSKKSEGEFIDLARQSLQISKESSLLFRLALFSLVTGMLFFFFLPGGGLFLSGSPSVELMSDFGSKSGVSFIVLFLTLVGLALFWRTKRSVFLYTSMIVTTMAFLINVKQLYPLTVLCIAFAAISFNALQERKWQLKKIKQYSLLLILLSMLFSTVTYLDRVDSFDPNDEVFSLLFWLEEESEGLEFLGHDGKVLAIKENRAYIEALTPYETWEKEEEKNWLRVPSLSKIMQGGVDNVGSAESSGDLEGDEEDLEEVLFSTLYPRHLFPLLEENEIAFIYVDPKTRELHSEERGLLFALRNENFKLLYEREGYELWLFAGGEG